MRAVVQRVSEASVSVDGSVTGRIGAGLCALVGVANGDGEEDARWLAGKLADLRIFEDAGGKMNLSVVETGGEILAVSQFTLAGNCTKGRRPSFDSAAPPEEANRLYEYFTGKPRNTGLKVETGIFQAMMQVSLTNDGPVTFILESPGKG